MDENQDFVIDTEMPVASPAPEEIAKVSSEETPVASEVILVEDPATTNALVVNENDLLQDENKPVETSEMATGENEEGEFVIKSEKTDAPANLTASSEVDIHGEQEPPATSAGPSMADIAALIEGLERKFDEKIAVDTHKNELFDKLYKERDEYKNDLYGKLLKPFITGAIQIITDLRMYISKMETYEVERSLNYLKSLPDDIIELLENNGVELYTEEGDSFNPRTQRAKKLVETDDVSLNNKIAERLEEGFRWNGVMLRPEYVSVYKTNN